MTEFLSFAPGVQRLRRITSALFFFLLVLSLLALRLPTLCARPPDVRILAVAALALDAKTQEESSTGGTPGAAGPTTVGAPSANKMTGGAQDKGGPIFNVKAYGAAGDGTTDDLEAIKSAIAAATSAGGGTILFPAGTYRTSGEIVITSHHINLLGVGVGATDIRCDASVMKAIRFGFKGTTPGTSITASYCSVSKMDVTRALGTIPVDSVGIAWESFAKCSEQDVVVRNHYYCRSFEGGANGISTAWRGLNCYAGNATRAYVWFKGAAGVTFYGAYFGYGSEIADPVYCIEVSGKANDINFTDATVIPHGGRPTRPDVFGFTNYTSTTGVFSLINFNTENVRYAFVSDDSSPNVNELKIVGGRWASRAPNLFNLDSATTLSNFSISGGATVAGNFDFPAASLWSKVQGCFFGGAVTLTGGVVPGAKGKSADMAFNGNTCNGSLTASGAWDALSVEGNAVRGTITNKATGNVTFGDNGQIETLKPFVMSVADVSLTTVSEKDVFTVPAGKTFVCTGGYAVLTKVTGYNSSVAPLFYLSSSGEHGRLATAGVIDPNVFNVVGQTAYMSPLNKGGGAVALSGSTVAIHVDQANTSTALVAKVFVTGFYY